jgi:hypothetical protein
MADRIRCIGVVRVPLPAAEAIELFTPEGERRWAEGWDPRYPSGDAQLEPATIFVTEGHGRTAWVVVDAGPRHLRYARISADAAGTVTVRFVGETAGSSTFEVAYDLTALGDEGRVHLDAFERGYADEMAEWERAIAASLER